MFVAYRLTSIWIAFLKRPCLSFSRAFINEDPCFAFPLRTTISRRVGWREVRLLERIEPCVISVSKTARQHLRRKTRFPYLWRVSQLGKAVGTWNNMLTSWIPTRRSRGCDEGAASG